MGSIFAECVEGTVGIRKRAEGAGRRGKGGFSDKNEEEARLKELLRVDFLDGLTSGEYVPVQLRIVVLMSELRKLGSLLT